MLKHIVIAIGGLALVAAGSAKLPAATPEQQAAAALNAAKAAHAGKVDAYTLCLSQTKVADSYIKEQKANGKAYTAEATPACVNPGPFVPPAAVPVAAAAPAQPAAAPTAPAQPPAAPKK
jgi:hypothetical protein